jgi:peptide/nickel transport system substrate-binding protein
MVINETIVSSSYSRPDTVNQDSAIPEEKNGPSIGGTFIEGSYGGDAETLNWLLAADGTSHSYIGMTIDTLANYNNDLEINLLCLAKDIEASADGLVYTVTIRDDLKWSDGSQVTADDYVYTLKNLMFSDWLNYPYRTHWQEEVGGQLVYVNPEVVDSTTFTVTRQTVDPEFAYTIYDIVPYPRSLSEKYEGDMDAFMRAPEFNNLTYAGNLGPYKFKEWIRNDRFVCERNPDYYLGKEVGAPYFDEYVIKLFGNSATMLAALEAGDITYCGIEPEKVAKFKSMNAINVYTIPSGGYITLVYNQRANGFEGLKERSIRQAISMAISKEKLSKSVYLGFAAPSFSLIPNVSPWYDDSRVTKYGVGTLYDKQKAAELSTRQVIRPADLGSTFRATQKNGQPLSLTLVTNTGGRNGGGNRLLYQAGA